MTHRRSHPQPPGPPPQIYPRRRFLAHPVASRGDSTYPSLYEGRTFNPLQGDWAWAPLPYNVHFVTRRESTRPDIFDVGTFHPPGGFVGDSTINLPNMYTSTPPWCLASSPPTQTSTSRLQNWGGFSKIYPGSTFRVLHYISVWPEVLLTSTGEVHFQTHWGRLHPNLQRDYILASPWCL